MAAWARDLAPAPDLGHQKGALVCIIVLNLPCIKIVILAWDSGLQFIYEMLKRRNMVNINCRFTNPPFGSTEDPLELGAVGPVEGPVALELPVAEAAREPGPVGEHLPAQGKRACKILWMSISTLIHISNKKTKIKVKRKRKLTHKT